MKAIALAITIALLASSNALAQSNEDCDPRFEYFFQHAPIPGGVSPELGVHRIEGTHVAQGGVGTKGQIDLWVGLQFDSEDIEVQGWSVALLSEETLQATYVTTVGTAGDSVPTGLRDGGFEKSLLGHQVEGRDLASAVVLSFTAPVTLPPTGTATILRIGFETAEPLTEAGLATSINFVTGGYNYTSNTVAADGSPSLPCFEKLDIEFDTNIRIRRGDSNADDRIDISDAIYIFLWLFLGGESPPCQDSADADDSGVIDITDGLLILLDFFQKGTSIADPGPFECGFDPTPDDLLCSGFAPCA